MKVKFYMKALSLFYIPIIGLLIPWNTMAAANSVLNSPECIKQFKQPSAAIQELSALLERQQLKSFYEGAKKHTLTFSLTTQDNIDTELEDKIWHCYLVASAPFFSFKTYQEIEPEVNIDEMADINQKSEIFLFMDKYINLINNSKKIKKYEKNIIIDHIFLPYYALILKQFKNANEHTPYRITKHEEIEDDLKKVKVPEKDGTVYIKSQEQLSELWNLLNEAADGESFINLRNQVIEEEIKDIEKSFIEVLVSVFPGKYAKVEEFILKGGYSKDEIPDLIDRTVGRDNKTDFLYKGKHRLIHDKLLKKKR